MIDIIDEIKEDIRRERYTKIFTVYGKYLVGAAAVALIATGGITWYQSAKEKERLRGSDAFYGATKLEDDMEPLPEDLPETSPSAGQAEPLPQISEEKTQKALDAYDAIVKEETPGYDALASLRKASILAKTGEVKEAVAAYDGIAADANYDAAIRELAELNAVSLLIDHPGDAPSVQEDIEKRLAKLSNEHAEWKYNALEMNAYRVLSQGNKQKALELFEALMKDTAIPEAMFDRTSKIVSLLRRELEDYNPFAGLQKEESSAN